MTRERALLMSGWLGYWLATTAHTLFVKIARRVHAVILYKCALRSRRTLNARE